MIRRLTFIVLCFGLAPLANAQRPRDDQQLLYELLNRIELLEQELRQLRGEFETYQYKLDRQGTGGAADERVQALERRLRALERTARVAPESALPATEPPKKYTTNEPPLDRPVIPPPEPEPDEQAPADDTASTNRQEEIPPPAPEPQPAPGKTTASGSEQEAYDGALGRLREGRYDQAISGLQGFLADHPNSPLAGNAHYWLGETYYVTRDFEKSRQSFETLQERFPRNEKVPDALLKLGYIYAELGDKAKARAALGKLAEGYPNSKAAMQAQKQLKLLQ